VAAGLTGLVLLAAITIPLILAGRSGPAANSVAQVAEEPSGEPALVLSETADTPPQLPADSNIWTVLAQPSAEQLSRPPALVDPAKEPSPVDAKPVPVIDQPKPEPANPAPARIVVKRRQMKTEEELRRRLQKCTEVALDLTAKREESTLVVAQVRNAVSRGHLVDAAPQLMKQRSDLAGLPMRMGDACKIGSNAAEHLQGGSVALRAHLLQATAQAAPLAAVGGAAIADTRPDPKHLHDSLTSAGDKHNNWLKPEAVPALQQRLMAENEAIRSVLVDQLARINGPRASAALAQRALFDLNADVRKEAIEALASRPHGEYLPVLVDGLVHPWMVAADHAAEALVALGLRDALPQMVHLLDAPDPTGPYQKPGTKESCVKEMVRINHLRNCLLCHAASFNTQDKVRGLVPTPGQPIVTTLPYYSGNQGTFVRADVTYLQQDFSVPLPVAHHGVWPEVQRFDFLVRERPVTLTDLARPREKGPTDHQKALFFALRGLTKADPGPTVEDWKRYFSRQTEVKLWRGGYGSLGGIAADRDGNVFVSDHRRDVLLKIDPAGNESVVLEADASFAAIAFDRQGRLIACKPQGFGVVAIDVIGQRIVQLADRGPARALTAPQFLAGDRHGGVYIVNLADEQDTGAVQYISSQGTSVRLANMPLRPRGIALAADESSLYVIDGDHSAILIRPLESAGNPTKPPKGKPESLPDRTFHAMCADEQSNLYVGTSKGLLVLNSAGARLSEISMPDPVLHLALGGPGRRTLYLATPTALYTMQLAEPPVATAASK
jgi:sugar lactone lactonase YvrE